MFFAFPNPADPDAKTGGPSSRPIHSRQLVTRAARTDAPNHCAPRFAVLNHCILTGSALPIRIVACCQRLGNMIPGITVHLLLVPFSTAFCFLQSLLTSKRWKSIPLPHTCVSRKTGCRPTGPACFPAPLLYKKPSASFTLTPVLPILRNQANGCKNTGCR
jgi:hypothetical protein